MFLKAAQGSQKVWPLARGFTEDVSAQWPRGERCIKIHELIVTYSMKALIAEVERKFPSAFGANII
jgi:hypothetical protein